MSAKKNPAASVRQRLLNVGKKSGEDFQLLLTRYAIERLLFRLAQSEHANSFVLKGAMLFALWTGEMHRPTRDVDLLGYGENSDDRLAFDADSVAVEAIREAAEFVEYPSLLGMESPKLRAYPKETVVAEKVEAMVKLGLANTRMKDFYDVLLLARTFPFQGEQLRAAITAAFARRGTPLPAAAPVALTEVFAADDGKGKQWKAFVKRSGLEKWVGELSEVIAELVTFVVPPLSMSWVPGGPLAITATILVV